MQAIIGKIARYITTKDHEMLDEIGSMAIRAGLVSDEAEDAGLIAIYRALAEGDDEPIEGLPELVSVPDLETGDFVHNNLRFSLILDPSDRSLTTFSQIGSNGGYPIAVFHRRAKMIPIPNNIDGAALAHALRSPSTQLLLSRECDSYNGDEWDGSNLVGSWSCFADCDSEEDDYYCGCVDQLSNEIDDITDSLPTVMDLELLLDMYCDEPLAVHLAEIIVRNEGDRGKIAADCSYWREEDRATNDMIHGVDVEDHAFDLLKEWIDDNEDNEDEDTATQVDLCRRALALIGGVK